MIRSRLNGLNIHSDMVNPKLLELEAAKEMLANICDIQIWDVDDLIMQRIVDFQLIWSSSYISRLGGHVFRSLFLLFVEVLGKN